MLETTQLLDGKYCVITGANRGIGRATAELFAQQGAKLILNGRNSLSLDELANELTKQYGVEIYTAPFDVSDAVSTKDGFQAIFKVTKKLDVLVNNAGILEDALIGMVTRQQMERVFSTNSYSILYTCQYASRLMARNQAGSIINLTSIIGRNGNVGQAVYGGSKAAVIGITQSLAKELAPSNIRVNAIAPGFIDTDMARSIPEEKFAERVASIKLGRIGTPHEIAQVSLFLASQLSSYVTGQIIGVDGGMLI